MPTDEELIHRIETIEDEIRGLRSLWSSITDIKINITELKTLIQNGHACKWNGTVSELSEFKKETPQVREKIFNKLDEHDNRINAVEDRFIELTAQNNMIMANQEYIKRIIQGVLIMFIGYVALWLFKTIELGI